MANNIPINISTTLNYLISLPIPSTTKHAYSVTPAITNKALKKPKRLNKTQLALCPSCLSPHVFVGSDIREKYADKNAIVNIKFTCLTCKYTENKQSRTISVVHDADFKSLIEPKFQIVKTPALTELKFVSFTFQKNKFQAGNKAVDIYGFCQDDNGNLWRFGNTSALKLLYFAVKDRKFKAYISFAKHYSYATKNNWASNAKTTLGIGTFRQSPQIVGGIELI